MSLTYICIDVAVCSFPIIAELIVGGVLFKLINNFERIIRSLQDRVGRLMSGRRWLIVE